MPPLALIYPRFAKQISNLQGQADNVSLSIRGTTQRLWRVPDLWTTGVFDIQGYAPPFTRKEINDAYPYFYKRGGGTVNDAQAAKWQAVHLSGQERAFRLQEESGIRCAMHAAARRAGQANSGSGSFGRILNHIIDVIKEGGA
jgi:hypothetical protein